MSNYENLGWPSAKVIKKSTYITFNADGTIKYNTICTFELHYPRLVLCEFNTHRAFSRNAASSRAIPFVKMVEQLNGRPVRFGVNKAGMADGGPHDALVKMPGTNVDVTPEELWEKARDNAVEYASALNDAGYHKQVVNRLTEPFQMIKAIVTSTEWDNFFWLRYDEAADPTLQELAKEMLKAYLETPAKLLGSGEWHLPFVHTCRENDVQKFYINDPEDGSVRIYLSLEEAQKVSAARCAAVSFRRVDYTLEKSVEVYNKLVGAERKHASAFEHQAKVPEDDGAINVKWDPQTWEPGISHVDRHGNLWSGNFKGWVQFRKLIPGENYTEFDYDAQLPTLFPEEALVEPEPEPQEYLIT